MLKGCLARGASREGGEEDPAGWSGVKALNEELGGLGEDSVSNTLPADPAEVAAAGTGDVTEACADGGRDDCQKPPAGELLGTTTTA